MLQKSLKISAIIIALAAIFISGCEKKVVYDGEIVDENVEFTGKMLHFKNPDVYEAYVSEISYNEQIKTKLLTLNTRSLHNAAVKNKDGSLYPEALGLILSDDKTVRIGNWIILVDLKTDRVRALHSNDIKFYKDLVAGKTRIEIYEFSTSDDVLRILDKETNLTKYAGDKGLFCRDRKANKKEEKAFHPDGYRECKVKYCKAGIYFSLYANVRDHYPAYIGRQKTKLKIEVGYRFDDRCDRSYERLSYRTGTKNTQFPGGCDTFGGGRECTYRLYESSWQLKKYQLDAYFSTTPVDVTGNEGSTTESGKFSIKDGY